MINEIINNINIDNIDNEYAKLAELYINYNNIDKNMLKGIEKRFLATYYEAYKPETGQIFINRLIDKKIDKDLKYDSLIYKYNVEKQILKNILKLTYFMHELRHVAQFDIYINKPNFENIEKNEDLYKKIIIDFIEITKTNPKLYFKYYDENIVEKDAEMSSFINTINLLIKLDNQKYKKVLNYMIDYFIENTIRTGYTNKNLQKPTLKEMYNLMGKENEFIKINNKIETLSLYDKLTYNSKLNIEDLILINNNSEETIKTIIKPEYKKTIRG